MSVPQPIPGNTVSRFFTGTLNGTVYTIVSQDFINRVTILVTSGTVAITGDAAFPNSAVAPGSPVPSSAITLPNGTPLVLSGNGPNAPIHITIDATAGSCLIIMQP